MSNNQSRKSQRSRSFVLAVLCVSLAGLVFVSGVLPDTLSSKAHLSGRPSLATSASKTIKTTAGSATASRKAAERSMSLSSNLKAATPSTAPRSAASDTGPVAKGSLASLPAAAGGAVKPMASGATINVTTTAQKIGGPGTGGCSLQEAIYSANLQTNKAIDSVNPDGTDHFVTTDCVAGTGQGDTIVLPPGAVFNMSNVIDDAHNYMGPTGTPIIFSQLTINANGSRLERTGNLNLRAFSVGSASIDLNPGGTPNVVSGTGVLVITNAHLKGFSAKGGNGASGGGGGLGAGGAIYVQGGSLTLENSTFEGNAAIGGNGSVRDSGGGGGGGGLSGSGGKSLISGQGSGSGGGGGGGARGNGGVGSNNPGGGGGGGTLTGGKDGSAPIRSGGVKCGGGGADPGDNDGADGACSGGGAGGGSGVLRDDSCISGCDGGVGGNGSYGGGGGGAGEGAGASGGNGGFGGGGGAPNIGSSAFVTPHGGNGGFGGGGSAFGLDSDKPGVGGAFGGRGGPDGAGGGALGGAIFNDSGTVDIRNCTFFGNDVDRGVSGGPETDNGADAGGAIFSRNGSLTIIGSTISGNLATGSGGGVVVINDGASANFTIHNTIIAGNGGQECFFVGSVTNAGSGNLIVQNFGCPGMVSMSDPLLGPLQLNAPGSTPTMAITTASAAFDAGDDNNCIVHDQRGVARPQFNHCDIGAYEVRPCAITCPANIIASTDPNQCGAVVNYPAPTTNGGDCGSVTCSPPSGSFFVPGITPVTCTSAAGNCSFTVTVKDNQPPAITCPPNMTATTGGNMGPVVVNYPAPTVTDNCPGAVAQCNPPSGSAFNVGTTTVVCTAVDAGDNSTSCSFTITVFNTALTSAQTGDSLRWNSVTGDYLFTHLGAGAFTLSGRGTVNNAGGTRILTDFKADRRVSANFLLSQLTGRATITVLVAPGVYQTFVIIQTNP